MKKKSSKQTTPASKTTEQSALPQEVIDHKELLEFAVDGILIGSPEGIIINANSAMQNLSGRTAAELIGKHVSILFSEEELAKLPLRFDLLKKGEAVISQRKLLLPDGGYLSIEMHTKTMPGGNFQSIYHDISDRIKTEKALKESEEKYRKTFHISPVAINIIRAEDGMRVSINEHFTKIMGYTESDIIGKTTRELDFLVNPEDRKRLTDGLKKDGVVENLEGQFRKKNGEIVYGLMSASLLELNGVPHIISITKDITERKEVEEALRTSESKLHAIFSAMTDVIIVLDAEGRYIEIAPSNPSLLYKPSAELLGKTLHEVFPKEQGDFFMHHITTCLTSQQVTRMEYSLEIADNKLWFSAILSPLNEKSVLLVARDISERELTEKKLKESEERFRNLVENITDVFYIVDSQGKMKYCSPNFFTFTGYSPDEILGHSYIRVIPQEEQRKVLEYFINVTNSGVLDTNFEARVQRKDGTIFWTEQNTRIVRDKKGNVVEYRTVTRDISQRKLAEDELRKKEDQMRLLVEGTPYLFFYTQNSAGEITYISPSVEKITGYIVDEWYNQKHWFITNNEINEIAKERTHAHLAGEFTNTPILLEVKHADGHLILLEIFENPIFVNGKVVGLQGVAHNITEQKLMEKSLQESEERYRLISSLSSDYLFSTIITEDGKAELNWVMGAFEKMTGYTLEEYKSIGGWRKVVHPEDRQRDLQDFQKLLKNQKVVGEVRTIQKNGNIVWTRSYAQPIWDEKTNRLVGIYGAAQDITEQKLAEGQIIKLSQAVEQSAGSIIITDLAGNIEYVNKKFEEVTGYSFEEVKGQNPRILKSGETVNEEYKKMWETISQGNDWRGILHNRKKDGSLYWENTTISSVKNKAGVITNYLAIKDDITEDKLKEEMLKKSELHFRSIWESSLDGMRLTNENGIVVAINNAFAKLFEKDKNEIIGKVFTVVYGEDSGFNDVDSFVNHLRKKTIKPFIEKDITLWNGKAMSVELTNSLVETEGQPTLLLSIFRDVTEKKQSEQEMIISKEKAIEANKVKTSFLENMSHELRTPMIPILGFTETMIEMEELSDDVKEMAVMMNQGAHRLMDTLNIILDLSQVEKERVIIKHTEFDLLRVIDDVLSLFQSMANKKNLYLIKEFSSESLNICTDERMLRHIINNLVNNGLKFTRAGGITIKTQLEKSGNENFAVIQVCDTGIGIPKDKQDIIWKEFRQASEGIGRSFEGNGLGLTITKNFVEQLKGQVWVESEEGKGTTFTIKLPSGESVNFEKTVIPEEEKVKPLKAEEVSPEPHSLKRVLYVEDEEISFSVVKHFLKNIVTLDWAKNGQDGVVLARGNRYDVILMDINLARGIDGMQTTKLIRELPQYHNIPIIAITAFAMRGDKEEFIGAGCSHYISKPFTKAALQNLIAEVFKE